MPHGPLRVLRPTEPILTMFLPSNAMLILEIRHYHRHTRGDKTQFRILRSRQRSLEKSNSIRAALNAYTNNLVFGNSYRLNVQGTERKNLVRSNALPDVNAVVVSDLDLRDLYRNQILENMDDAKAELVYQQRRQDSGQSPDVGEILTYLLAAQEASDTWFGFIPKDDVQQALEDVKVEPVFQKS